MDLSRLIALLSSPEAYPHPTGGVEVRQTHISAVFLAGSYAYKIKKPLDLGFLDFTTLDKRHHYCAEEVRLNRRLAPGVYLGAVPVTLRAGELRVGGEGEAVEWAVWMHRLPEAATLAERLPRGEVGPEVLTALARRLASFHAGAEAGEHVSRFGRWSVVARNARENFEQTRGHVGECAAPTVWERTRALTEAQLEAHHDLVEARARRGVPRDTHGDLHLDHVYSFPERPPPADLAVVDCIEFNERFRYADPVADAAFLAMDLAHAGRRDLAGRFADAYFEAASDPEGRRLLPLYSAYRAVVRAKVEGMRAREPEVPAADRDAARRRAQAHWLLALGLLEEPPRRPCLVLLGGLPGTGKSTLARALQRDAGFRVVATDAVRKELAGLEPTRSGQAAFGEGIYSPEWSDRVYAECLRRAEAGLREGGRVAVDANFKEERRRRAFLSLARDWAVPFLFLRCHSPPEVVEGRLAARVGDASDADWSVYRRAAQAWEEPGPEVAAAQVALPTGGSPDEALGSARKALRAAELL